MNSIFSMLSNGSKHTLVCFPYLGGHVNSFNTLVSKLSGHANIYCANAPGHGGNRQAPLINMDDLTNLYFNELFPLITTDYVFFGHSMGAIIAYYLAKKIFDSSQYSIRPKALILSACNTPSFFSNKHVSTFSDENLIEHLKSYCGISQEVLDEGSLLEYFLPIYRADFMLLESAANLNCDPLEIPVYLFFGENDVIVSMDQVLKWSTYFVKNITLIQIKNGHHMFIDDQSDLVSRKIITILNELN